MGTRSLIKVVEKSDRGGKQVYVIIYIHYGYLSYVGKQLATLLHNLTSDDKQPNEQQEARRVNGCGELAALILHHFKSTSPIGNCYFMPLTHDWEHQQEEFTYEVLVGRGLRHRLQLGRILDREGHRAAIPRAAVRQNRAALFSSVLAPSALKDVWTCSRIRLMSHKHYIYYKYTDPRMTNTKNSCCSK